MPEPQQCRIPDTCLWLAPQLMAMPDPQPTDQGQGSNPQPHGSLLGPLINVGFTFPDVFKNCRSFIKNLYSLEFPLWLRGLKTWLVSLHSLIALRIHHCYMLHCRLQMQLGSCVAVAVAVAVVSAGSCSSDSTSSLGTAICHRYSPKKKKIKLLNY